MLHLLLMPPPHLLLRLSLSRKSRVVGFLRQLMLLLPRRQKPRQLQKQQRQLPAAKRFNNARQEKANQRWLAFLMRVSPGTC